MLADDLRLYNSGATADGEDQRDASLCLGGYRAGTMVQPLAHRLLNAIAGVRILFASGANGEGAGRLEATAASALRWTAPGGTAAGAAVTIANGETKTLYDGTSANKFLIVTRTTAVTLGGFSTVTLEWAERNAIGFDHAQISGTADYRLVVFRNEGAAEITPSVYLEATGLEVAADACDRHGIFRDMSFYGDTTAPTGSLSFSAPSVGSPLSLGAIAPRGSVGLWIKRTPGAAVSLEVLQKIHWTFGAFANVTAGTHALYDAALETYLLYRGEDVAADLDGAAWETFADDPHVTADLAAGHTYHFVTRARNRFGLISQNIAEWTVTVDAEGNQDATPPTDPVEVTLSPAAGGAVRVQAKYFYLPDAADDLDADTWLVYLTSDGGAPDPAVDTPHEVTIPKIDGMAALDYTSDAFTDGATIKALVRTRRTDITPATYDDEGHELTPEIIALVDSVNVDVYSTTADATGPGAVYPDGQCLTYNTDAAWTAVWTGDASNYIEADSEREVMRFVVGGNVVAAIGRARTLYLAGNLQESAFPDNLAVADYVTLSGGAILFAVGTTTKRRVATLDGSGNLRVGAFREISSYPISYGVFSDLIEWHSSDNTLAFSLDFGDTAIALVETESAGIHNGRVQVRRVRENALL
jgi:hypothetical protein